MVQYEHLEIRDLEKIEELAYIQKKDLLWLLFNT